MKLVEWSRAEGVTLWEAMADVARVEGLGAAPAEAVRRFVDLLSTARRQLAETEAALASGAPTDLSLERWATEYLRTARLEEGIRAENRSEKVAEVRIGNLRDFLASITTYERRVRAEEPLPDEEDDWSPPSLAGFLERVSLVNDDESGKDEEKDGASHLVTLMTLHSAKGLEFPHVFLVGLEEEILPHARSVSEVAEGADDPVAEERRLFYVGLTRARHRLTLSGCRTRRRSGEPVPRLPSRFLGELPQEILEVRTSAAGSSLTVDESQELRGNFFAKMRAMLE
jgi:superfamily I DNA/RNA helicase